MNKNESGRSLIETLGVLMLAGLMVVAAVRMYQTVRHRQLRFIAEQELKTLVENTKIIYAGRKNYTGITKNYLIKTGVLKVEKIGGHDFRVQSNNEGKTFSVIFDKLDMGDCAYFATKKFDWATSVAVNGFSDQAASLCSDVHPNKVEFIVK